ncbi:hypothetical protein BDV95DRAFT_502909, partial [Massariosphaeria phaeospora]
WVYRENKVPHYQALFQKKDGLRLWEKSRGRFIMPVYKVMLFGSLSASMYMMSRLVLGHKTWFGKN